VTANFTFADLIATSLAFVLFALFTVIPGFVFSWVFDLLDFRRRSVIARLVIALPVSIGVFPVLIYLAWRRSSILIWFIFAACWLCFPLVMLHRWQRPALSRRGLVLCAASAGWVVLGMFCLVDLQVGERLYFPTVSYDYMLRAAITSSITRTGVPPDNPYFFPGHGVPLRYHYFWFLPCALVDGVGGSAISARQAMDAGTLWCGLGLMTMVPLYLRFFQPKGAANLERRTLAGIALLAVTGLDIIPIAVLGVLTRGVSESIEWWNGPVMAWTHAVLWVPHHVAALIACATGFLVVYEASRRANSTASARALAAVAAGLMFASAVGLSVYVTFVFAAALALLAVLLAARGARSEATWLALAGAIAGVVSLPYLMNLSGGPGTAVAAGGGGGGTNAGPLFELAVRPFTIPDRIVQAMWPNMPWLVPVANLVLLPLNYFLELGLFLVAGLAVARRLRRAERLHAAELCGVTIGLTSLLICTFVRSSVISNNDLGWRGLLAAQFILLIWAAELWDEGFFTAHARPALIATLLLCGTVGTVYEVAMVRFYTMISDRFDGPRDLWFPSDHHIGERTYAMRGLYAGLGQTLGPTAVLQHNPNQPLGDVFHGLYADRQNEVETPGCGVIFGGDAVECGRIMPRIAELFDRTRPVDWIGVESACRDLSIDALIVKNTDDIWFDRDSWVWQQQPVLENRYARAFVCRHEERRAAR